MFDVSAVGAPLDERYPEELADAAVAALQAALPDWLPRNASPELIFIEAVSLAVADIVNAGNATIGAVEEDILSNFYQVARRPGSAAGGQITVTFDSAVTTTIPAGTGFALTDYGIEVATSADVNVSGGTGVEDAETDLSMSVGGSNIVIAWEEEPTGSGNEVLRVNASSNLGATFNGAMLAGCSSAPLRRPVVRRLDRRRRPGAPFPARA